LRYKGYATLKALYSRLFQTPYGFGERHRLPPQYASESPGSSRHC
jgi:hypothetical protein